MYEKDTKTKNKFADHGDFYISCPYCLDIVYIIKVKCALFLHAYNTKTLTVLNPHTKWFQIDNLRREGNLGGCGGRFKLKIGKDGKISSSILD
jgi:hypothetical protein